MKVCLYTRVSSDAQDTVLSLSAQLRALRDFALKNGHEVVREFVDEAESGRSADRPAFKEMIALARTKHRPFEAILVWKLNRFARSREDSVTYKMLLKRQGIAVISINEPVDDSPAGRLLEGVIESIDEFYSSNLGQDIKRGMRENAGRGFFNGSIPPYGFRKVSIKDGEKSRAKLAPDPEGSTIVQVVERMFDLADKGSGCKEIAVTFNREGLRTLKGERWGRTTVHKILTNEAYCGTLIWGGRPGYPALRSGEPPIRVENAWPAIIDKKLFDRVRQKMAARSPRFSHPRTVHSPYLLSGILYCACGHAMTGHSAKSGHNFYYQCSRRLKQGNEACGAKILPKDKLERQVSDNLKARILTDKNIEQLVIIVNRGLASTHGGLKDRLDALDLELKDIGLRLLKLYDALETGKLDLADLAPRIKQLKARQDELAKARVQIEADMVVQGVEPVDVEAVKAYAQDLKALLEEADIAQRKSFIKSFVKRIDVNEGKVIVSYKLPLPDTGRGLTETSVLPIETFGGPEGARTPYLLTASQTLYQVSYGPKRQNLI
jgi:site-specific DNA recombinase